MSIAKAKDFPIMPRSRWLAALMQSCVGILAINWMFQGTRGMDRRELISRVGIEALLAAGFMCGMAPMAIGMAWTAILSVIAAHSLNFLFNGQVWVCVRYCRFYRREPAALDRYLLRTFAELRRLPWLNEVVCIGSQGAGLGTRGERSDIDLRLIFPVRERSAIDAVDLRMAWLLLRLRTAALLQMIPLDLYAYDSPASLDRFCQDEPLLVVLDRQGRIRERFGQRTLVAAP